MTVAGGGAQLAARTDRDNNNQCFDIHHGSTVVVAAVTEAVGWLLARLSNRCRQETTKHLRSSSSTGKHTKLLASIASALYPQLALSPMKAFGTAFMHWPSFFANLLVSHYILFSLAASCRKYLPIYLFDIGHHRASSWNKMILLQARGVEIGAQNILNGY